MGRVAPSWGQRTPVATGRAQGPWPWVCLVTKALRKTALEALTREARCTCMRVCVRAQV